MAQLQPHTPSPSHEVLSTDELNDFFDDIDKDKDGLITFDGLEAKLEQVHAELAPVPKIHHLNHPTRRALDGWDQPWNLPAPEPEKTVDKNPEHDGLYIFLWNLLPFVQSRMDRAHFIEHVRAWNIPSQKETSSEEEDAKHKTLEKRLTPRRRIRAYWSVQGPKILFVSFVVSLQLAFGIWQGVKYIESPRTRAAFGWGVILAKFCAGALYPTMFFMILSMSRTFATAMRKFRILSRFVNWDRSQSFHIWMASVGLVLATVHSIGHLTGTFRDGSRPERQASVAAFVGQDALPLSYRDFASSLEGWTGIASLAMFWIIAMLSMPTARRWSYEVFQSAHLLVFPMIGLLSAHGVPRLLGQFPILGFWLVFPGLLVIFERLLRIYRGFVKVSARLEILDVDAVTFSCKHPRGKNWPYQAGQYIFLQVPLLSFFQWHPFTISACSGSILQLHIKTDGNWTKRLRSLPTDMDIRVGIDGPYGAPAQRFYDFDKSIIIGSGVGITPFSAIVTDLELHLSKRQNPWTQAGRQSRRSSQGVKSSHAADDAEKTDSSVSLPFPLAQPSLTTQEWAELSAKQIQITITEPPHKKIVMNGPSRRVDFHWMVREKNDLMWFSSLLNRAYDLSLEADTADTLELNISTHITAKRQNVSTHIFRYLLDAYRTASAPYSALTGLKTRSHFGRPNLDGILEDFHHDMLQGKVRDEKVGVFFCGSPSIGRVLADACAEWTAQSRQDGSKIRYIFMMEVFG